MVQIIQVGSPEYNAVIEAAGIAGAEAALKSLVSKNDEALTQSEAMAILKVSSPQKMKQLRDSGKIIAKKEGREYKYSRLSIEKYISS